MQPLRPDPGRIGPAAVPPLDQAFRLQDSQLGKRETVALPVKAGAAIIFNDRVLHMSTPNLSSSVRWSVDLRYQPTDQDPMPQHGVGFLARSSKYPERVATLEDWLANRPEHL